MPTKTSRMMPKVWSAMALLMALTPTVVVAHEGHEGHNPPSMPSFESTPLPPTHFASLGTQRTKVTYGTFTVPSRDVHDGMMHFWQHVPLPCSDCLVLSMQADLTYANGSVADASTGMWMHHVVFVNRNRTDSVCRDVMRAGQRFFASGNERTDIDLTAQGAKRFGYPFHDGDVLAMNGELMNLLPEQQDVVVSVTWEYLSAAAATTHAFKALTPYWLDVGGCRGSEQPAKPHEQFYYLSPPLRVTGRGQLVFIGGHLHDGGTHLDVLQNDHVICTIEPAYSKANVAVDGIEHIGSMSSCTDVAVLETGDIWTIKAYYDTKIHPPFKNNDGSLEPVMGIALAYVLDEDEGQPKTRDGKPIWAYVILPTALVVFGVAVLGLLVRRNAGAVRAWWHRVRRGDGWWRRRGIRLEGEGEQQRRAGRDEIGEESTPLADGGRYRDQA